MQVRTPSLQHEVMIEAVENHMPQVIVIDEIGTELEAQAARTIAERGVQLIGTAHGNNLDNLMLNPTLSDLIGGIQSVTLGDEEARRRRTQKSVLERKAPPTFDVIVEIQDRERVAVHATSPTPSTRCCAATRSRPSCAGATRRASTAARAGRARRRASSSGAERFAGLVGAGSPWRMEPGWRGDGSVPDAAATARRNAARRSGRAIGPGRPAAGARPVAGPGARRAPRGPHRGGWRTGTLPGERFAPPCGARQPGDAPFVAGDIADRGPLERGAGADARAETRAREARELERQKAWRDQAARALNALQGGGGDRPGQRRRPRGRR